MPIVSLTATSYAPISTSAAETSATAAGVTAPSNGQPNAVETYARIGRPASLAREQTSRYVTRESAIDWLMLRRLNDSDAAAKIAISSTRASIARARPAALGTSACIACPAGG